MKIDAIIISDSHGRAIENGAKMLGLNVRSVTFSGGYWHKGRFRYNEKGFIPPRDKMARQSMAKLQEELGVEDVIQVGIPVISTIGFHLGQLVPPFGWNGHIACAGELSQDDAFLFASQDFVVEFIDAFRQKHFKMARLMNRRGNLIVLPPPVTFIRPNYSTFRTIIKERMKSMGIVVFDPVECLAGENGVLPSQFISGDGVHASDDYGIKVIEELKNLGLI